MSTQSGGESKNAWRTLKDLLQDEGASGSGREGETREGKGKNSRCSNVYDDGGTASEWCGDIYCVYCEWFSVILVSFSCYFDVF